MSPAEVIQGNSGLSPQRVGPVATGMWWPCSLVWYVYLG